MAVVVAMVAEEAEAEEAEEAEKILCNGVAMSVEIVTIITSGKFVRMQP